MTKLSFFSANIWLMKSEPSSFSFDNLLSVKNQEEFWDGVRNYQARNFMMKQMKVGQKVLFYHSNANPPGIAGIAEVTKEATPDPTAFDPKSRYYDPKSTVDNPRWFAVTVGNPQKISRFLSLQELRSNILLKDMWLLKKGQRLSILPVSDMEYKEILDMLKN